MHGGFPVGPFPALAENGRETSQLRKGARVKFPVQGQEQAGLVDGKFTLAPFRYRTTAITPQATRAPALPVGWLL